MIENRRLWRIVGGAILAWVVSGNAQTSDTATPIGSIAVGDSPFALTLSDDDTQAVVVRVVDVGSVTEVAQIPVGSRPSNVVAIDAITAMVTNGTSGDVTFVDIPNRTVSDSALSVGADPRAAAVHPGGQYVYVTLGGENAVAVVDLSTSPQTTLTKVSVGRNPVAIAITPDGTRAVVAKLTSNTVSVLDLTSSASPRLIMNVPVGVQPTSMAVNPANPNLFYVANLGSSFFSVIDISESQRPALTGVVQMGHGVFGSPGQHGRFAASHRRVQEPGERPAL